MFGCHLVVGEADVPATRRVRFVLRAVFSPAGFLLRAVEPAGPNGHLPASAGHGREQDGDVPLVAGPARNGNLTVPPNSIILVFEKVARDNAVDCSQLIESKLLTP